MLHVDEFEREVVDFVAGTFGFRGGHWGVVTNGGTDGNLHGIYFGRKTLEAKSELPADSLRFGRSALFRAEARGYPAHRNAHHRRPSDRSDGHRRLPPPAGPDTPRRSSRSLSAGTFKGAIDDQRAIDRVLKEVKPARPATATSTSRCSAVTCRGLTIRLPANSSTRRRWDSTPSRFPGTSSSR